MLFLNFWEGTQGHRCFLVLKVIGAQVLFFPYHINSWPGHCWGPLGEKWWNVDTVSIRLGFFPKLSESLGFQDYCHALISSLQVKFPSWGKGIVEIVSVVLLFGLQIFSPFWRKFDMMRVGMCLWECFLCVWLIVIAKVTAINFSVWFPCVEEILREPSVIICKFWILMASHFV